MQTASDRASLEVKKPVQGDPYSEDERNPKRNILNEMEKLFPIFRAAAEVEGMANFRSES